MVVSKTKGGRVDSLVQNSICNVNHGWKIENRMNCSKNFFATADKVEWFCEWRGFCIEQLVFYTSIVVYSHTLYTYWPAIFTVQLSELHQTLQFCAWCSITFFNFNRRRHPIFSRNISLLWFIVYLYKDPIKWSYFRICCLLSVFFIWRPAIFTWLMQIPQPLFQATDWWAFVKHIRRRWSDMKTFPMFSH